MPKKNLKIIIEKTNTGFSAFAEEYPIFTTSDSMAYLIENVMEAVNFYFEEIGEKFSKDDIVFEIDFQQFFKYYKVLNAKFLAKRIGMNPTLLSQYVQGHKKPSAKQTEKILTGIHQIGKELTELQLLHK